MVHVHCIAHQLALALSQAANHVNAVKNIQETVASVYKFYNDAPVCYNTPREIEEVLKS